MTTTVLPAARPTASRPGPAVSAGYKVDISRGERIGRVSSEWFSRPDDERYLSLGALHTAVRARAERATARTVETKALRVEATRHALFAHCVSLSVNAIYEPYNRRPKALAHADRLATAVELDMASAGWVPTIDTYFGRVTKARIMGAVREAKGDQAATRIAHLKKPEMAAEAEVLLAGSGWLPEPLRTPGRTLFAVSPVAEAETVIAGDEPAAIDGEPAVDDAADQAEDEQVEEYHAIAAE